MSEIEKIISEKDFINLCYKEKDSTNTIKEMAKKIYAKLKQSTPDSDDELTIDDYKDAFEDKKRLCREIDEILNGKDGMSKQASLCDLVSQIRDLKNQFKPSYSVRSAEERFVIESATGIPRRVFKINFDNENNETHVWCEDWYGHHIIGKDCHFPSHPQPVSESDIEKIALEKYPIYFKLQVNGSYDIRKSRRDRFIEGMRKANELIFKTK